MAHFCLVFVFSCALLRGGDILMLGAREVVNITTALPFVLIFYCIWIINKYSSPFVPVQFVNHAVISRGDWVLKLKSFKYSICNSHLVGWHFSSLPLSKSGFFKKLSWKMWFCVHLFHVHVCLWRNIRVWDGADKWNMVFRFLIVNTNL